MNKWSHSVKFSSRLETNSTEPDPETPPKAPLRLRPTPGSWPGEAKWAAAAGPRLAPAPSLRPVWPKGEPPAPAKIVAILCHDSLQSWSWVLLYKMHAWLYFLEFQADLTLLWTFENALWWQQQQRNGEQKSFSCSLLWFKKCKICWKSLLSSFQHFTICVSFEVQKSI